MTLPNFVGIGAAKCGTTWMHNLLQQHPKIYMPKKRKELDFFNLENNYSKGLDWYESFFPDSQTATQYSAIGEFTPRYLNHPKIAREIANIGSIKKLIVMLRNPIQRTYSQYSHAIRNGYSQSFQDYLSERPHVIQHSLYAQRLQPFLDVFDREQFCFFIFEESIDNVPATQQKIAKFLNVDVKEFPDKIGPRKANKSYVPKYKSLNRMARNLNQKLRQSNLDWIVNWSESLNVRRILEYNAQDKVPSMSESTKLSLQETFISDIEKLENQLNIDLSLWRS